MSSENVIGMEMDEDENVNGKETGNVNGRETGNVNVNGIGKGTPEEPVIIDGELENYNEDSFGEKKEIINNVSIRASERIKKQLKEKQEQQEQQKNLKPVSDSQPSSSTAQIQQDNTSFVDKQLFLYNIKNLFEQINNSNKDDKDDKMLKININKLKNYLECFKPAKSQQPTLTRNPECFKTLINHLKKFNTNTEITDEADIIAKLNKILDNDLCNGQEGFNENSNKTEQYDKSYAWKEAIDLANDIINKSKEEMTRTKTITIDKMIKKLILTGFTNIKDFGTFKQNIVNNCLEITNNPTQADLANECESNKEGLYIEKICGIDKRTDPTKFEVKWQNENKSYNNKLCNTLETKSDIRKYLKKNTKSQKAFDDYFGVKDNDNTIFISFCKYYKNNLTKNSKDKSLLKDIFNLLIEPYAKITTTTNSATTTNAATTNAATTNAATSDKPKINKNNLYVIFLGSYFLIENEKMFDFNKMNNSDIKGYIKEITIAYEVIEAFGKYMKDYDINKGFYKLDINQIDNRIESTITLNPLSMAIMPLTEIKHDFPELFNQLYVLQEKKKTEPQIKPDSISNIKKNAKIIPSLRDNIHTIMKNNGNPRLLEIFESIDFSEENTTLMMLEIFKKYKIPFINESAQTIKVLFDMTEENLYYGGTTYPSYLCNSYTLDESDTNMVAPVLYSQVQTGKYHIKINKLITDLDAGSSSLHQNREEEWERELQLQTNKPEKDKLKYVNFSGVNNGLTYKFNLKYKDDNNEYNILSIESTGNIFDFTKKEKKNTYNLTLYFLDLNTNPFNNQGSITINKFFDATTFNATTFTDNSNRTVKGEKPLFYITSNFIRYLLLNTNGILKYWFTKQNTPVSFTESNINKIRTALSMAKMCGDMQYSISSVVSAANNNDKEIVFLNSSRDYSAIFNVLNIYPSTFTYTKDSQSVADKINKLNVMTNMSSVPSRGMFFAANSVDEQKVYKFLKNDKNMQQIETIKKYFNRLESNTFVKRTTTFVPFINETEFNTYMAEQDEQNVANNIINDIYEKHITKYNTNFPEIGKINVFELENFFSNIVTKDEKLEEIPKMNTTITDTKYTNIFDTINQRLIDSRTFHRRNNNPDKPYARGPTMVTNDWLKYSFKNNLENCVFEDGPNDTTYNNIEIEPIDYWIAKILLYYKEYPLNYRFSSYEKEDILNNSDSMEVENANGVSSSNAGTDNGTDNGVAAMDAVITTDTVTDGVAANAPDGLANAPDGVAAMDAVITTDNGTDGVAANAPDGLANAPDGVAAMDAVITTDTVTDGVAANVSNIDANLTKGVATTSNAGTDNGVATMDPVVTTDNGTNGVSGVTDSKKRSNASAFNASAIHQRYVPISKDIVPNKKRQILGSSPNESIPKGGSRKHKRNKNKTRKQKRNSKNKTIKRKKSLRHKRSQKHH
jgi:hypothetical protein